MYPLRYIRAAAGNWPSIIGVATVHFAREAASQSARSWAAHSASAVPFQKTASMPVSDWYAATRSGDSER